MKLFKTTIMYDVIVAAEDSESARATLQQWIDDKALTSSESVALEVRRENEIRPAWRDRKPLVGSEISETDFDRLKGKTALEAWQMLYTKEPPIVKEPPKKAK